LLWAAGPVIHLTGESERTSIHPLQKMTALVCFALKEEAAPFRKIAAAQSGISILLTGIGSQNAGKTVREFLGAHSPELVLTCGFAGGLNPELKPGEVVFEIENRREEFPEFQTKNEGEDLIGDSWNSSLREKLLAAGARPAKFFCADRIAITVAEKKQLRHETGADAVEMESAAVHVVCRERGIPCATIRAISDTAGEDLPLDFNALARPDKNLDYGKLFLAIAQSPGKIGALINLQKKTRFAAEELAGVLGKITFP
jgi:adenosylhomocysteine nucleosidase